MNRPNRPEEAEALGREVESGPSSEPSAGRGRAGWLLGLICVGTLLFSCFGDVLLRGEQFGYRDAAHFYYPLYQRVEQEWSKGRLPLWDARENSGMPLLGNPTAAVLYPGKLIYRALPYPWAARLYTIAHVLLALGGMYVVMRRWEVSRAGSLLSAISYAFGAPILFQYCNIIFLVGAAWVPIGLGAADTWLRTGRRSAILVLAGALAMQVLGGDPQAAYVTGLCSGAYAVGLALARRADGRKAPVLPRSGLWTGLLAALGVVLWFGGVLFCAWYFPSFRPPRLQPPAIPLPWSATVPPIVAGVWAVGLGGWFLLSRRSGRPLPTMLSGLMVAAVLAGTTTAAQLLPSMEYTGKTVRAAEDGPHDIYPFSLEIWRLAEFVWPDIYGSSLVSNATWATLLPPKHTMEIWVPSLYLGGPTIVLALAALGFRRVEARRAWLGGIALVAILASLGEFGSPLWLARNVPEAQAWLGPHDPLQVTATRMDGKLRDGDGGVYSLMTIVLPGFGSFRYPSKLLTFACFGLSGLAGIGLDRMIARKDRRAMGWSIALLALGAVGLIALTLGRSKFLGLIGARIDPFSGSAFGPVRPEEAWRASRNALAHGCLVMTALGIAALMARRRPRASCVALLLVLTLDLIVANARLIISVPQSVFDRKPEVLRLIEEAEEKDPSPGPFRVHRMPYWDPQGWHERSSPGRYREMVEWEHKTLQPKYGIPYGLSYTLTEGVAELYDYWWFFSPFYGNRMRPNAPPSEVENPQLVYHPRRGFDLWNTRYFILPAAHANDEKRATYSFMTNTEAIWPRPERMNEPDGPAYFERWTRDEDWHLVRNKQAFPRAWVVHSAELREPITGLNRKGRQPLMLDMLYLNDRYWTVPNRDVIDLKRTAFVETTEPGELLGFLSRAEPNDAERVTVEKADDLEMVLRAKLLSNGLVILSDIDYPGWELTIDGRPARIWRTNRLMRGAAVPAGEHLLVYRYRPRSLRVGMALSAVGLALGLLFGWRARSRPIAPEIAPPPPPREIVG